MTKIRVVTEEEWKKEFIEAIEKHATDPDFEEWLLWNLELEWGSSPIVEAVLDMFVKNRVALVKWLVKYLSEDEGETT